MLHSGACSPSLSDVSRILIFLLKINSFHINPQTVFTRSEMSIENPVERQVKTFGSSG
jgi:predicted transcriptional regulator